MRVLPIIATYVLGAALLLACLANVADLKNANHQSEDFTDALKIYTSRGPIYTSNFSTNDKPKMSFSTPSGNRMIYNPAEDPEFIQKLDLYRIPCEDGDEEACFNAGKYCLLYTSPSPRDATLSRMPSSA